MVSRRSFRLALPILFSFLAVGCATVAVAPSPPTSELGSGRFALRGSFLPEPSQGRFEWRVDTESRRNAQTSLYQEVVIQDPWGQVQGVFSWRSDRPGPWAGWALTDPRGRSLLPEQFPAANSLGEGQSIQNPQALQALAELLHAARARLDRDRAAPMDYDQTRAFTLRQAAGKDWVELRIVLDDPPDCSQPSPMPGQAPGQVPGQITSPTGC
jgi:hypothetical protein